jgi:hypothetical protein
LIAVNGYRFSHCQVNFITPERIVHAYSSEEKEPAVCPLPAVQAQAGLCKGHNQSFDAFDFDGVYSRVMAGELVCGLHWAKTSPMALRTLWLARTFTWGSVHADDQGQAASCALSYCQGPLARVLFLGVRQAAY